MGTHFIEADLDVEEVQIGDVIVSGHVSSVDTYGINASDPENYHELIRIGFETGHEEFLEVGQIVHVVRRESESETLARIERLEDECLERAKIQVQVARSLESFATEPGDVDLGTFLEMTALALRSEPIPKGVRERMEADRAAALAEDGA